MLATPLGSVSLPASGVQGATSRDLPSPSALKPSARALSCSRRPSRTCTGLLSSRTPANPSHALVTRAVEIAAQGLAVQVQMLEARGPDEFDSAFATMTKEPVEALYV